jgi:hypothetical protein
MPTTRGRRRRRTPTRPRADVREPEVARPDGEERDAERRSGDITRDHETASIEAVRQPPRPRRCQEDRQLLRHDQDAHREGLPRHLEHQTAERDEQEPVATERDHRCEEQAPEVAVPPQQGGGGAGTRRALPVSPFRHGLQDYRASELEGDGMLEAITWFRQAALRWRDAERTIYIDPWGTPADAPRRT